jgi:hypothetical protein
LTNAERILHEYADLVAVLEMLAAEAPDLIDLSKCQAVAIAAKKEKVEQFLRYSAECGTLTEHIAQG